MLKITNSFEDINQEENAVVYFTADWCQPCKQLKPQYAKVAVADPESNYYMVDVDKIDLELLNKYGLKSVPQIFVMNKGEIEKPVLARTSSEILDELGRK